MSEPLVSVIMGSFEPRWDRLRRAVSSLVGQTWERWELLLWDDGSSLRGRLALAQAQIPLALPIEAAAPDHATGQVPKGHQLMAQRRPIGHVQVVENQQLVPLVQNRANIPAAIVNFNVLAQAEQGKHLALTIKGNAGSRRHILCRLSMEPLQRRLSHLRKGTVFRCLLLHHGILSPHIMDLISKSFCHKIDILEIY